jgi:CRISPR-associated exonuclease Cas4
MESYVTLSFLNDFIFCPRSIYFHQLYSIYNDQYYKQKNQIAGTEAHATIDSKTYSTRSNLLQGIEVFSEKYNIAGKIDVFDINTGRLTERKKQIKVIYDGYVFQVYAQYFALTEMGYTVKQIIIHDLTQNKNFEIQLPENDAMMLNKFEQVLYEIANYDLVSTYFTPHLLKCEKCIYSPLCDKSLC